MKVCLGGVHNGPVQFGGREEGPRIQGQCQRCEKGTGQLQRVVPCGLQSGQVTRNAAPDIIVLTSVSDAIQASNLWWKSASWELWAKVMAHALHILKDDPLFEGDPIEGSLQHGEVVEGLSRRLVNVMFVDGISARTAFELQFSHTQMYDARTALYASPVQTMAGTVGWGVLMCLRRLRCSQAHLARTGA